MTQTVIIREQKQREFAKALIDRAPTNAVVTVREAKRSLEQNALFWEIMNDLAKAMPEGRRWSKETWRDAILHATGHAVRFEAGLEGAGPFPVGFRSSKLSKAQMSICIEFAFAYGAKHGVTFTIDKRRWDEAMK